MINFTKVNGLGNSFIFFEEFSIDLSFLKIAERIKLLCSVNHGLGADGVVFLKKPYDSSNHCCMQIFNSDGTEAEVCGNALRGAAMLFDRRALAVSPIMIEARGGIKKASFIRAEDGFFYYQVQMGKPEFDLIKTGELVNTSEQTPLIWQEYDFLPVYVNIGNPHAVIFLNKPLDKESIKSVGAWLEVHHNHPRRINIEFVQVLSRNEAVIDVWERGCGITQACGTGSCAVAAAGIKNNFFDKKVTVHMPGGSLIIEEDSENYLHMTGSIIEVASGQLSQAMEYRLGVI